MKKRCGATLFHNGLKTACARQSSHYAQPYWGREEDKCFISHPAVMPTKSSCSFSSQANFPKTVVQQNLSWEVACFDMQVPFLRQYLGDDAIIHPVPLELIHDHLKAERRSLI